MATKSEKEYKEFLKNKPYIEETMKTIEVNNEAPSKQIREIKGASMYGRKMMLASNGHTTHIRYLSEDGKSMISRIKYDRSPGGGISTRPFTGKELGAEIISQKVRGQ